MQWNNEQFSRGQVAEYRVLKTLEGKGFAVETLNSTVSDFNEDVDLLSNGKKCSVKANVINGLWFYELIARDRRKKTGVRDGWALRGQSEVYLIVEKGIIHGFYKDRVDRWVRSRINMRWPSMDVTNFGSLVEHRNMYGVDAKEVDTLYSRHVDLCYVVDFEAMKKDINHNVFKLV